MSHVAADTQWAYMAYHKCSGVTSYGALGHVFPLKLWKKINLTVKLSKIFKEKHVLYCHLSRQKHAKTHVNRLKQSRNQKEIPGGDLTFSSPIIF